MLKYSKLFFSVIATLFLLLPLIAILPLAFTSSTVLSYPIPSYSLRWFTEIFENSVWFHSIINSLIVGTGATVIALVLGILATLGMRKNISIIPALNVIFMLPMVVPAVVIGVGMQIIFSNLGINNSYTALIIAHSVISIPFVIICVSSSLNAIDKKLEFAALSLGASPFWVFAKVTLPLCSPGIAAGAVLAFATSLDEVVLTMFVAGPSQRTLARQMFSTIKENISPTIAAAAALFIVTTIIMMLFAMLIQKYFVKDIKV